MPTAQLSVQRYMKKSRVFPTNASKGEKQKISLKDKSVKIDEKDLADFINHFFVNVGNTNVSAIKKKKRVKVLNAQPKWSPEIFSEREVYEKVQRIKPAKSSGLANVSGKSPLPEPYINFLKKLILTWIKSYPHLLPS